MAMVVHQDSDKVIYQKKAYTKTSIASLTKLMTAMVIIDSGINLQEKVKISKLDIDRLKWTGSRIPIGTKLSRFQLLSISLMSSDNRAASALSRSYPGGKRAFIKAMNVKALKLGMHNSRFEDPTGLDKRNISTARDLVRMARAAYQYPLIRELSTNPKGNIKIGKRKRLLGFSNTNSLVRKGQWNIGLSKTGFIREAGRCLLMQTIINKEPVIIVLLDSYGKYTRIADAKRIRKWMEKNINQSRASTQFKNIIMQPS
jgi:D-alanyl-D-alanine endopeptidase (penicillin-binding protein 7)